MISILIIRYLPLDESPLLPFLSLPFTGKIRLELASNTYGLFGCSSQRSMKFFKFSLLVINCSSTFVF